MYTITVTSTAATNDEGTLPWAIAQANAYTGTESICICFADELAGQTITLNGGLTLRKAAVLTGPASGLTIVGGTISSTAPLTISHITLPQIALSGTASLTAEEGVVFTSAAAVTISSSWNGTIDLHGATATASDAYVSLSGTINGDSTFAALPDSYTGNYRLTNSVTIESGKTVTLEDGAAWEFDGGSLNMYGTLRSEQREQREVIGTHLGSWGYLYVEKGGLLSVKNSDINLTSLSVYSGGKLEMQGGSLNSDIFFDTGSSASLHSTQVNHAVDVYGDFTATDCTFNEQLYINEQTSGGFTATDCTFNNYLSISTPNRLQGSGNTFTGSETLRLSSFSGSTAELFPFIGSATAEDAYISLSGHMNHAIFTAIPTETGIQQYRLTDSVTIERYQTVTLEDGAAWKFDGGSLDIDGTLRSEQREQREVIGSLSNDYWGGVCVYAGGLLSTTNGDINLTSGVRVYSGGRLEMEGGSLNSDSIIFFDTGSSASLHGTQVKQAVQAYGDFTATDCTFNGSLRISETTHLQGSGNTFTNEAAISFRNIKGDIAAVLDALQDSTFTAENAYIVIYGFAGDTRLTALPEGLTGGYDVWSDSVDYRVELADGVSLSCDYYATLQVRGSLIAEGHNCISTDRGITLLSGAELHFDELSINGKLAISEGAVIQGHTLILTAKDALRISIDNWDGIPWSGWDVENVILQDEHACVAYEINGIGTQELRLTQELLNSMKIEGSGSVIWDLTLGNPNEEQNDTLILNTAIDATQITVKSGSKLVLEAVAGVRFIPGTDEYGMMTGGTLTLESGAELDCQGGMLDGRIVLNRDAIITGTMLTLGENAMLVLDGWEGDISEELREYFGSVQVYTTSGSLLIEINGASEELVLSPVLQNTDTCYIFTDYMLPAQHVTVSACEFEVGAYCSLVRGTELTLTDGARLYGNSLYGDATLWMGEDSRLEVTDSTVDFCLDINGGELSLHGAKLTQQHAFTFRLTGEDPTHNSALRDLQKSDYACTHENAYALWTNGGYEWGEEWGEELIFPEGIELFLTEETLRKMTPKGCRYVAFSQCAQGETITWTIGENVEWYLESYTHIRGRLELQSGSSVRSIPGAEPGRLVVMNGGVLAAENALIDTELVLYEGSELEGHNWHFGEHSIVTYYDYFTEEFNIGEALSTPLDSLSYDVATGGIFRLGIYELAGDTTFTQEVLNRLAPAGFETVELASLNIRGQHVAMNDLHFSLSSDISISGGELLLRGGSLGQDDDGYVSHIQLYGGHLLAENTDLNHASLLLERGNVQLLDCQRVGDLSIDSGVFAEIHGCDLSESNIYIFPYQSGGVIDLSGNYWGTNDRELILSRIRNYSNVEIRLDSIIPARDEVGFTFSAAQVADLNMSSADTRLTLAFTHAIDAASVTKDSIKLFTEGGEELPLLSTEVKGRTLILHTAQLPTGSYRLVVSSALKDTDGNEFNYHGQSTGELALSVTENAATNERAKVLLTIPNSTLFSDFRYIDIYYDREMDEADISAQNIHLFDSEGRECGIETISTLKNSKGDTFYRVFFKNLSGQGSYQLAISGVEDATGAQSIEPYYQELVLATPDLEVAGDIRISETISGRYATVTYSVTNKADGKVDGTWYDSAYLCPTAEWDEAHAILLGRKYYTAGSLGARESYTNTLKFLLNGIADGDYYLFVRTDSSDRLNETNEANNLMAYSEKVSIRGKEHPLSTQTEVLESRNETLNYTFTAAENGIMSFGISIANAKIRITAAGGAAPAQPALLSTVDGTEAFFYAIAGGTYDINIETRCTGAVTTTLKKATFGLTQTSRTELIAGRTIGIVVHGSAFEKGMRLYLQDMNGNIYEQDALDVYDFSSAKVTFTLPKEIAEGAVLQLYAVDKQQTCTVALKQSLVAHAAGGIDFADANDLSIQLRAPGTGGRDYAYSSRVGYVWEAHLDVKNDSVNDEPNALILVTDTSADLSLYYNYDESEHLDRTALLLLAGTRDASPNELLAQEQETLGIFLKSYRSNTGYIEAQVLSAQDESYIPEERWAELGSALRPAKVSEQEWNDWWGNMRPRIGSTVADFSAFVHGILTLAYPEGAKPSSALADAVLSVMQHQPNYLPCFKISGMVTDDAGGAYAGARLELYTVQDGERKLTDWAESDADGNYALYGMRQGLTYELVCNKPFTFEGNTVTRITMEAEGDTVLNLAAPACIGRVEIPLPAVGDSARAYLTAENGKIINLQRQGSLFFAEHVAGGSYTLFVCTADGASYSETLQIPTEATDVFRYQTTPLGCVSGTLLQADGITPESGQSLVLTSQHTIIAAAVTDADGQFRFTLVPAGEYTLESYDDTFKPQLITIPADGSVLIENILTERGLTVTGMMEGLHAGHCVELRHESGLRYFGYTDANGRFSISAVPAGVYRLYTDTAQVSPRELVLEAAGAADVELGSFSLPDKPRLSGQLSCGGLSANGTVTLYKDGEAVGSVMTDANGRFNFLVNSPGTYTVFAVAENGSFCCTPQQIMAEAQQENADIMLECGTGYAALENINFLTKETALSATLSYVGDAAEYEIVTLNSLSALAAGFAGLAAGSYRLVINTEKERHTATFHVGNGERTAIGDFVATPLHSFRLQVVIGDKAAPQADVYLYGDNNVLVAHAQADENGLASFKNLPEGIYRCVSFSADGAFSQELEWNLRDTSDSTIELEAPQNSISGTLSGHATGTAGQTIVQVKDDAGVLIGSGTVQSDGTYLIGTLTGSRAVRLEAYNPTTGQTAAADMTPGATVQPELQLRDADEDAVIPLQPEEEQEKQPEIHLVSPTKLTQQLNAKNRTVTLTWETAAPNPPGTTYELVYSYQALPNGTWSAPHHMALGNVNSVTMPVEDESLYTWRIIAHHPDTAVTAAGDIRNFKVDFSAPGIPTGISILKEAKEADKRCNDISVSWEKSVDVSAIKGYNVLVSAGPAASKSQATFVTGLSVNASNLEDGYYYVHIQAVDEFDNESEWAHEMFLIDTTAPTLTGLNAPQVAGDNAFITWGAAQDISSIDGYDLLLTDTQTGLQQIIQLNGDVTSYMLRDLSGGAYTVRVRAYDTNNNISDWSESRSFLIERTPERSRRPSDAIDELQYQLYTRLKNQLVASDVITTRCCSDRNFKLAYMQQRDAWEAATADLAEVQQLWDEFVQGVQAEAVALGTIVATLLVSTEAAVAITAGSVLLGGAAFIHEFIESVRGFNRANAVEGLISILSGAANVMSDTASLGNLAEAARKFEHYQELLKYATAPDAAQRLAALRELENNPFVREYASGMRVTVPALLTGRSAQQLARSFRATSQFLDRVSFVLQVISGWQLFRQYQEINTRLESLFNDVDSIGNYISDAMEQKQQLLDCIQKSPCENPDPQPARLGHQSFASFDPNDIYGPQSYGDKGWIKPQEMQFAIECENIAKENIAHTAMVTITHHVDEAFDYSTFRLGDMMIAGNTIHIEDDIQNYKARVDWTATLGVLADVNVVFDADTGDVTWEFIALDPETHRVINDPFAGLLAPNYHSPEGEGMVYYTVTPKGGTATGTEFSAQADIIFDFNEVIQTPVIRYTIDNDAPEAAVNALPEISDTPYLLVSWQGHDVGSGMAAYNVYVSVDGGAWQLWQQDIAATEALFRVEAGEHLYAFMAEATDRAGNTETTGETVAAEAHTVSLYSGAGGVLGVKSITGRISESELGVAVSFTAAAECRDWSSAVRLTVGGHELDTQSGTFDYDAELHLLTWRGEPQGSRAGQGLSLTLDTRQIKGANGASLSRQGLSFSSAAAIEAAGEAYAAPTLYDYDGDGLLDLLVGENAGGVGQIRLYLNEGSAEAARFSTYRYLTTAEDTPLTVEAEGCQGAIVRFADLNGDGADEMFIGQADGSIRRFLATADGHWADAGLLTYLYGGREETMNVSERAAIDFCDLNSDGIIDILIGTGSGNIAIFYGTQQDGTVIFTEGQYLHDSSGRITVGSRASVTAGDFDGDGLLDLLVGSSTGTVLFYRNAGNAATPLFTEGTAILLNGSPLELSAQSNRLRITAADLNGDGTAELLMGLSDGRILQANGMPGKDVRMDTALQAGKLPQALKVRLGTPVISRGAAGGITVSLAWTANQAATYTLVLDGNTIYHGTDETFTFMVESGPHSWSITAEDADGNTLTADGIRFSENGVEASDINDIRLSMIDSAPVGTVHNQTVLRGTLCPTDAHDYYSFTATADGTYQLGLRDLTLGDMVLAVGQVSADGFFRAQYSIPTGANYTNAIEGLKLRKGETAYIRISSEAAAETAYELRVAGEVPAAASLTDNNTAATADALVGSSKPAAVQGWVGYGDACDFYRLQLAEASNLQLSLSGVDTAARVKVYAEQADGAQALISTGTATAVAGLDRTLALTAGSYFIEVAALNPDSGLGNSAYTMELKEQKGRQSTHYMLAVR